jgi:NADPH2:quinone reductase
MMMKAATVGLQGLVFKDIPVPEVGPDEVRVKVQAAALNRADLAVLAGNRHGAVGGAGTVMGMEWAGVVDAVGSHVQNFKSGDRVMGSGQGAMADFTVVDQGRVMPLPVSTWAATRAACYPMALNTMHDAVITNGGLKAGQSVMIQGASTGVGLMGLHIARWRGASVVVGSSTQAFKRERLANYGATLAVDNNDPQWVDQVLAITQGRGVDLIVDQLSGRVANQNMAATAVLGRIVNVGRLAGTKFEFDFDLHALRRIQYIGVTFRTRSKAEVSAITAAMMKDLWPALAQGGFDMPIDKIFGFSELAAAYDHMKSNQHFGKIIVQMD